MSAKNENDDQMEVSALQNNFIKQQAQISALKELVRKTEITNEKTTYTQEKVKNIAQRLTHIKSKVRTRQNSDMSFGSDIPIEEVQKSAVSTPDIKASFAVSTPDLKTSSEKPRNEKFLLLRQQMKQNKLKMAEREVTKKEIEEKVVQLKAKIDSTQLSLEKSTELGRSMTELSSFSGTPVTRFRSSADLSFIPLNIDKERIKFLENRIKFFEKQQENEKEFTNKGHRKNEIEILESKILDLEDILKEKECIIQAHVPHRDLLDSSLNKVVETANYISDGNYHNEIEFLKSEILNLKEINNRLAETYKDLTVKNSNLELEYTNVQELNKNLQNHVFSLEHKKAVADEQVQASTSVEKTSIPYSSDVDKIKSLEIYLESEKGKLQSQLLKVQDYEEQLMEKDVEYNVLKANFLVLEEKFKSSPKTLFSQNTDKSSETEINKLKQQLDDSNKSMIKLKLKTKQLQKQIDEFGKISNTNNELINLVEENQKQQKRINDLQEENRQLHLNLLSSADESNTSNENIYKTTHHSQNSAIKVLEADKLEIIDKQNQLQNIKTELYSLLKKTFEVNNKKIPLPEVESMTLEEIIENFNINMDAISCFYTKFRDENLAISNNYYINENIDLIDDIGKSKKSNSSPESIEFIERPTQQGKDKFIEFEQVIKLNSNNTIINQDDLGYAFYSEIIDNDLIESLVKLREESSELLHKIEVFTIERKELLDQMEILSNDNQENIQRFDLLGKEKIHLQENVATLKYEKSNLENIIQNISDDNTKLKEEIDDLKTQIAEITNSVEPKSNLLSNSLTHRFIKNCENHVEKLYSEIENYRKINNKNNKLQASKTLANEAEVTINEIKKLIEINKSAQQLSGNVTDLESNIQNLDQTEIVKTKNESIAMEIQESNKLQSILDSKVQMLEKENHTLKTLTEEFKEQLIDSFNEKQLIENHNDQLNIELNNKQETINTLNSQIMELYDSMEQKTSMLIEKEDSLFHYKEILDAKLLEIKKLEEENNNNKSLFEKHVQYETDKLHDRIDELEKLNGNLELKAAKQLEKLKKFAANIKKKNLEYNNLEEKIKFLEQKYSEQNLYDLQEKIKFLEEKDCSEQKLLEENNDLQEKIKIFEEKNCCEQKLLQENNDLHEKIKFLDEKNCFEQHLLEENNDLHEKIKFLEEKNCFEQNLLEENNDLQKKIKIFEEKHCSDQKLLQENNELREKLRYFEDEIEKMTVSTKQEIKSISEEYQLLESKFNLVKKELDNKKQELEHSQINLELFMNERDILKSENITQLQDIGNKNIYIDDLLNEINANKVKLNNFQTLMKEKDNEIDKLNIEINLNSVDSSNLDIIQLKCNELKQKYEVLFNIYNTERQSFHDKIFKLESLYKLVEEKLNEHVNYINTILNIDEELKDNNKKIPYIQHDIASEQVSFLQHDNTRLERNFEDSLWYQLQKNEAENSHRIELSESDLINVNKNRTDDEALIENENKRLKAALKKKGTEIEMYKKSILQMQQSPLLPLNEEFEEVSNTEKVDLNEKYDILKKETMELTTILRKKDEQINNLMKLNQLGTTSTSVNNDNILNEENKLSYRPTQSDDETISSFVFCPPYFDEEAFEQPKQQFTNLSIEQSVNEKSKIENLQRNVSDLEKVVEDLKNKLQHLTTVNEELSLQMDQNTYLYNKSTKEYEDQNKTLKSKLELSFQQNIENILTTDSLATIQSLINSDSDTIETNFLCESGDVDYGWGWDEKSLEEKNKKIAITNETILNIAALFESETKKVQSFVTRVEELELEQKRLLDEKQALQIKSGKMMKKLKEYKIKVDQQNQVTTIGNSVPVSSVDLDLEIQEQMKNQIFQLEKKTTEIMQELTNEKNDKKNLLKRINTLVASNEKLYEIKEQQHMEINNLQRHINKMSLKTEDINCTFEKIEPSGYESTLEQLEKESFNIMNNVDSFVEEFHNKLNENVDISAINHNDTQESREKSYEKKEKKIEKEITEQDTRVPHIYDDDNSSGTKNTSTNTEKEMSILNEHILFCTNEIEGKWNSKIKEFVKMWDSNILENGSISQENVNILQNKLRELIKFTEDQKSDIIKNISKTLENQKLEIVTLQDQLALRSAQCDPYAQISYSMVSSSLGQNNNTNKSELDLTLYMLHQRDMRCEELQLELIHLLKERDILQLKLSNTIRQNEEFREKLYGDNPLPCEHEAEKESPFNFSSISLQNRLSQLDSLKSKNILENRDRVLERMQQDVANIPTEAVTELVGEEFTNSAESASTLLFNWLWGKSRPS